MSFAVNSALAEITVDFSEDKLDFFGEDILNEPVFVSDDDDVIDEEEETHLRNRFRSSRSRCYTDRNLNTKYSKAPIRLYNLN